MMNKIQVLIIHNHQTSTMNIRLMIKMRMLQQQKFKHNFVGIKQDEM